MITLNNDDLKTARKRLLQMHYESGVGHIGGNLSALDAVMLVIHEYLNDGNQFILSKGHSAGALYVALWSNGLLTDDDLTQFHGDGTQLPGHPPASGIAAIPYATGSLGHGLSLAAGAALARRLKGDKGHVFCLTSDGEWQEGSTWEALIFLCHHRLTNLTILVDHNNLQGFGSTQNVASMAPLEDKLRGFDVELQRVAGHDLDALRNALSDAAPRPRILILETVKGYGVSFMENHMDWHYLPLSESQYHQALREITER
jgi:transketolase